MVFREIVGGQYRNNLRASDADTQVDGVQDLTDELADQDWGFDDPILIGLPPIHDNDTAECGINRQSGRSCSRNGKSSNPKIKCKKVLLIATEILQGFMSRPHIFLPNHKATYSNVAFILLGIVLENITGKPYGDIVESMIFKSLAMQDSTLKKPRDSNGIIPMMRNDWGYDFGAYNPYGIA